MAKNNGYKVEERIAQEISVNGSVRFKKLNNDTIEFPVSDRVLTGGKTTRNKWDILVNSAVRLQVKSTSSARASIVNMVPVRNMIKMSKRELIDVEPALQLMEELQVTGKAVKLAEVANYEDWFDLLRYLLFEGTPTAQEVPALQANYLLEESAEGDHLLLTKTEAIPYIWKYLVAELRTRKGKTEPCLHVRYGK